MLQTWQTNLQHYQQFVQQLAEVKLSENQIASQRLTSEQQQQAAEQTAELLNRNLILLAKFKIWPRSAINYATANLARCVDQTAHPFATHQPYTPDDTEQQLAIAKQRLDDINHQLQQLLLEEHALTNNQQQRNEHLQHLQAHNQRLLNQLQLASQHLIHAQPVQQVIEALPPPCSPSTDEYRPPSPSNIGDDNQGSTNQQSSIFGSAARFTDANRSHTIRAAANPAALSKTERAIPWRFAATNPAAKSAATSSRQNPRYWCPALMVIAEKQHQVIQRIDKLLIPFATRERTLVLIPHRMWMPN